MKNKQYRLTRVRRQLEEKKRRGIKSVKWRLNEEMYYNVTEVLHYEAIPYLYRVQTRTLKSYKKDTPPLLKNLHYNKKQGKQTVVMKLSKKDKELLDEYGIRYWVEKYKIVIL